MKILGNSVLKDGFCGEIKNRREYSHNMAFDELKSSKKLIIHHSLNELGI